MDFAKDTWQNPIRATELDREQRRLLHERFGDVGLGEADPQPRPTIGSEYGHRFMAAFWGCEIVYMRDQYPAALALPDAHQRMVDLAVPDVDASLVVRQAFRNARLLEERYGYCRAAINYGGPLNNGVSVLGDEMLRACAAAPTLAGQVLRMMGEAVLAIHDQVECAINRIDVTASRSGTWGIGNCPVFMLSPRMYRDVVLPVDLWFRNQFAGDFNLHHCGIFQPYAQVYRPLHPAELDVGPGTDLRVTRAAYPQARISTYIEVGALAQMSQGEIDALIAQMVGDAAPAELFTYIRVAEAGPEVSDETARNLMTVAERI
jgi:hypothetical protein